MAKHRGGQKGEKKGKRERQGWKREKRKRMFSVRDSQNRNCGVE